MTMIPSSANSASETDLTTEIELTLNHASQDHARFRGYFPIGHYSTGTTLNEELRLSTVMCPILNMNTTVLFRPVGEAQLALIGESRWRAFPPRLPDQPIFYPVVEEEYAIQIARDWNTRNGGKGFVLRFQVNSDYLAEYQVQTVGSRIHREYWIPAEDLAEFNQNIVGTIEVVHSFVGTAK